MVFNFILSLIAVSLCTSRHSNEEVILKFHIIQIHIRQVGSNNRHSIVVFTYLMPILYLLGVAIGIQLEATTHIATCYFHVLVDNDDLCIVVLSQHITEIVVG